MARTDERDIHRAEALHVRISLNIPRQVFLGRVILPKTPVYGSMTTACQAVQLFCQQRNAHVPVIQRELQLQ